MVSILEFSKFKLSTQKKNLRWELENDYNENKLPASHWDEILDAKHEMAKKTK